MIDTKTMDNVANQAASIEWTAILAIIISVVSLVVTVICAIYNVRETIKFESKQKIFGELMDDVYFSYPSSINNLLYMENPPKDYLRQLKQSTVSLRKKFEFLRFRNEKKYNEIRMAFMNIEDCIGNFYKKKLSCIEKREKLEKAMKNLYKILDSYFYIAR